jgi:hypothetical protein
MSGFGLSKTVTANVTPSTIVFFDKVTPTTVGVVFDPNTPETTDTLYVSSVDASTWIWDGSDYVSYNKPSTASTEWYLYGTTIDAGSNKTASIQRSGAIFVNVDSYFYDVRVGRGSGGSSSNTIVGDKCLLSNTTGIRITAVGSGALQSNTASNNTAIGWGSLNFNSSGANNTGFGSEALLRNVTGSNNSGFGYAAGEFLANGSTANTTPQNSVFLGYSTRSLTNNDTNQIVIGYQALGKGSNTVQLGNTSITATYLQGEVNVNPVSGQISRAIINSDNNVGALLSFRTANLPRWAIRKDGNETGSNVGGDLAVRRYDDAGAFIDTPISIKRSTGVVTLNSAYALPTTAPTSGQVLGYLGAGTTQWTTAAGGLTYFTEAQNTASPNATVPVDSLTAVTGTTNGDFAIIPKGSGAILSAIPDGTATGGGKRGAYAIDFQRVRSGSLYVAAASYSTIIGGSNHYIELNDTATIIAGGTSNQTYNTATNCAILGGTGSIIAGGTSSFIISSSSTMTAASYSAIIGGSGNAITGNNSVIAGGNNNNVSGTVSFACGSNQTISGNNNFSAGQYHNNSGQFNACFGMYGASFSHSSRFVLSDRNVADAQGGSQKSNLITTAFTTSTAPVSFTTYNGTAIALVLQNNNSIRFKGMIVARQSGSTNTCAWDFDGIIQRGANAASTTIVGTPTISVITNIPAWGNPTLTANTVTGGLDIKAVGVAATNIKWVATFETVEVIYA